ncbi:MAG: ABC transporter permease [Patescibacteria group bacterium]
MNTAGLYTLIEREIKRMFRVVVQTLVSPWISALLYILIFGLVVGSRISSIGGVSYIDFVLPGLVMMNIIQSAFAHSSSSVYFARFTRQIEEVLVSPLSYMEMIIGYTLGGVVRGIVVGIGVYAIAIFFTVATIEHLFLFLLYATAVSAIFSLLGILVGLWADGFEQLSVLSVFVITPLTFIGGVFNTTEMLPPALKIIAHANPFFYFVDGLRYAMIGFSESNMFVGALLTGGLLVGLLVLVQHLFKIGYKVRL